MYCNNCCHPLSHRARISENGHTPDRYQTAGLIELTATFLLECCLLTVTKVVVLFRFILYYVYHSY